MKRLGIVVFLVVLTLLGYSQNGTVPELIYYKFNQTGTTVRNEASSPVGTNPAPLLGVTIGAGGFLSSTALLGTGQSGNYVNTGWNTRINGDFTLAFWTSGTVSSSTLWYIFGDAGATTFRCFTNGVAGANNWMIRGGGLPDLEFTGAATTAPAMMHAVYNASAGTFSAYVNGVHQRTIPASTSINVTGTGLTIGGYATNSGLNGALDEFRWYNRALTAQEISDTYDRELPLMGAPNDAGIVEINSPKNFCSGREDVIVTVQNDGSNQIDSVDVFWELDGIPMGSKRYIGLLDTLTGTLPSSAKVNLGNYGFLTGSYNIKAWTSMPNGQMDTVNMNDTISRRVAPSLVGYYTIDRTQPTGRSNYNSFREFIDDLNTFGVCGPVVAEVLSNSGPYNEKLSFSRISGASPTNTIKILGNGNTVQYANTSTDLQLLTLDGTKHLTIDNLNFKTLDATYGWGALITGGSEYDTIINCTFDLSSITGTASASSSGIAFSGSNTAPTTAGNNGKHCYIANNHLKGGTATGGPYYALTLAGNTDSNTVHNNTFQNFYMYGIYMNGTQGNIISNNDFNRSTKTTVTTFYGIYTTGITPGTKIIGNRFHDAVAPNGTTSFTSYIMYLLGDGTDPNPVIVANNLIYNWHSGGTVYGIYLSTAPHTKVYHNTISFDKVFNVSATLRGIYTTGDNTGSETKNNIVSITGGGTGIKYGFYYNAANSIDNAQKNNIYVNSSQTGTQYYGYYAGNYSTQADFHAAYPNLEVRSPSVNPQFEDLNTGNFLPLSSQLIGAGENLLQEVGEDILHHPRYPSPTIGAYENSPSADNDASLVDFTAPIGSYCPGQQEVKVLVSNAGRLALDSVEVHWTVNGIAQSTVKYHGPLVPITMSGKNIDTVTLGTLNFSQGTSVNIRAWTALPNGAMDTINVNDTVASIFSAPHIQAIALSDTVCLGSGARLELDPPTGYATGAIKWQRLSSGNWVDIPNSDLPTYEDANITNNTWYRANIGGSNGCYTDSVHVVVTDPRILTVTPGISQCGRDSVLLSATATPGSTIKWYESLTSNNLLGVGSNFMTPILNRTDTFFVAANTGGADDSLAVPIASGNTVGVYEHMFTISANTELTIESFGIKANQAAGTPTAWNIYYRPDDYNLVAGANSSATGWTLVSSTSGVLSRGTTTYTDISSNMGVTIPGGRTYSFYISPQGGATHQYHSPANRTIVASNSDLSLMAGHRGSSPFGVTTSGGIPTLNIKYGFGCESTRRAVVATINSNLAPTVNLGGDRAICDRSSATLDAGNPGSTYQWSTGATTQTIQINRAGRYIVHVTNASNCTASDTINVTIDPLPVMDSIRSSLGANNSYNFTVVGDRNATTYEWNFGDGNSSNQKSPSHSYTQAGIYEVTLVISNPCGTDTARTTIEILPTGIAKKEIDAKLSLYPNPAKDVVYIENNSGQMIEGITIYNILGQNVYETTIKGETTYKLNTSQLTAGIYNIKIKLEDGSWIGEKLEIVK